MLVKTKPRVSRHRRTDIDDKLEIWAENKEYISTIDSFSMRLVQPTDFDILELLVDDDGNRNVASNIALRLDRDRPYINTRLPELADQGLLERIGPAEGSGLYEITPLGQQAVAHRVEYDEVEDFEALIDA